MKPISLTIFPFILIVFLFACQGEEETVIPFPDFSTCQCNANYDPVCGEDGRNYLNDCLAACVGVTVKEDTLCPPSLYDPADTMTWPIEFVCIPVSNGSIQEVRLLGDGTMLYRRDNGTFFRGNVNMCICLPPETLIATPEGQVALEALSAGDLVWTRNLQGKKVSAPIIRTNSVYVGDAHRMVSLTLADGRSLTVSPPHPDLAGTPLGDLEVGDSLDGSLITGKVLIPYKGTETMDLLPEGATGLYYANEILIGSTLFNKQILP